MEQLKRVLTYKGAVMAWECDSNRHLNVMYYINKFEHAGHNFEHYLKIDHHDQKDEIGMVVLEQTINYYQEVFEDDILYIESTLLEVGNKAFRVLHEMYNGRSKERVSTMRLVLVLFDKINRKALPFPKERKLELQNYLNQLS